MSGKNSPGTSEKTVFPIAILEYSVPVLSLGGAGLALISSATDSAIDIRFFAAGCIISSFLLAYLAWIRPQKDIVALSTPIYSFVFFVIPSDTAVTVVLELLYAASITILLVRLKLRFGDVGSAVAGRNDLEEPLLGYCASVQEPAGGISPAAAHSAALVFIRFAQADYPLAAEIAGSTMADEETAGSWPALATAFAIVREQALLIEKSAPVPGSFTDFSPRNAGILAKPPADNEKAPIRFEQALDNALLLLFAAAWNRSSGDRPLLLSAQGFARKLMAP